MSFIGVNTICLIVVAPCIVLSQLDSQGYDDSAVSRAEIELGWQTIEREWLNVMWLDCKQISTKDRRGQNGIGDTSHVQVRRDLSLARVDVRKSNDELESWIVNPRYAAYLWMDPGGPWYVKEILSADRDTEAFEDREAMMHWQDLHPLSLAGTVTAWRLLRDGFKYQLDVDPSEKTLVVLRVKNIGSDSRIMSGSLELNPAKHFRIENASLVHTSKKSGRTVNIQIENSYEGSGPGLNAELIPSRIVYIGSEDGGRQRQISNSFSMQCQVANKESRDKSSYYLRGFGLPEPPLFSWWSRHWFFFACTATGLLFLTVAYWANKNRRNLITPRMNL